MRPSDRHDSAAFLAQQPALDVQAADWLVRRQDGLDDREEAAFQQWLAASAAHAAAYGQLTRAWYGLDALPDATIARLRPVPASKAAPSPPRLAWLMQLCQPMRLAGAAVVCAVLAGWQYWLHQPVYSASFASARGEQLTVELPDGSTLRLDTATRADVTLYRQRREVRLPEGQALLTVAPDKTRPFEVLAGPVRVTVLGTRFSVRHTHSGLYGDGANVQVEHGIVRVAGNGAPLVLTAGQAVRSDAAGKLGALTNATPEDALLWREGRAHFNNTPLRVALAEFERYGPTHLRLGDAAVGELRLNGSFKLREVASFRRALPQVLPLRLHEEGGSTVITAAP
ncbi:FecR family protein [Janthinobacterium sp. GMG1]|uniref:FecR family protein n=1 Tax=Janthinobacterium sp. GMG1 TaxID=3096007 RepID=UPI002ACAFEDB|nr:FecR domain-containing protein [Janthinobacterium sp. GMG1]MDZ5636572.1 FecR domain-containing protein [Janthinobacterium sp. GMG1]